MDLSTWAKILLGIYAGGLTTYTVIKSNRERRRQLSVSVSTGWRQAFHDGSFSSQFLLITVTNPGNRKVIVNTPYLKFPDGRRLATPVPLSNVRFPYKLEEGDNCAIWIEMNKVKSSLLKNEYSGIVKLKGEVLDGTNKVYTSKKSCDFNTDEEYD